MRIWGYGWMMRELVQGLEREYLPLLRRGCHFDDDFGRTLAQALPVGWQHWSAHCLRSWLTVFGQTVSQPLGAPISQLPSNRSYRLAFQTNL
ncbi:MAG: hypothetical protein R2867_37230 [Caldilineaceae bacterium]|nr:hypothetical protein [Caldilineaceae bacterium]